jgi:transcription-repair coupling factor (superfamily II helicase)
MSLLIDAVRQDGEYGQLLAAVKRGFRDKPLPLLANGLCEGASDAFITALLQDTASLSPTPPLIVCSEEKECLRIKDMLALFGITAAFYPVRDLTFYNISASHEYEHERIRVLSGILSGAFDAVITTPDAMLGYTISADRLLDATLTLDFDTRIDPEDLARRLLEAGYARVDMVDGAGQFARRGGIVDIYPPMGTFVDEDGKTIEGAHSLRIELFDDEIDRMVFFDIDSQRTIASSPPPPSPLRAKFFATRMHAPSLQEPSKISCALAATTTQDRCFPPNSPRSVRARATLRQTALPICIHRQIHFLNIPRKAGFD